MPEAVQVTDSSTGSSATILANLGFNCYRWRPVLDEGPREMLWAEDGFAGGDKRPSSSGIPLLFPFPGRIGGAAFHFQGRPYRLEPGDGRGNAIHGFVYNRPWRVVEQQGPRIVGEFQASVDDASILDHWPADFRIRVSYEVQRRALVSVIRYENTGDGPLPCGFGTHAYFRLPLSEGGDAADTVVTVPVERCWEAREMLPTGRLLPVPAEEPLARGMRLGNRQFDTCFTGLSVAEDGHIYTRLEDPARRRGITQVFEPLFTQCVVYTPAHRGAICVEPYTCVPDAFRLVAEGHETGLQILEPGDAVETTLRIAVDDGASP